jgi:hypothetical protein
MPEGGFPQRFPPSRSGSRSDTSFYSHTHRRWGSIGSRGTAADRGHPGGVAVRDFRVFDRGQYEYEYERLRIKCAKAATLGYWTPSELLSFGLVAVLESNRLAISRTSAHLVTSASHLEFLPPLIGLDTARRVDGLYTLSL